MFILSRCEAIGLSFEQAKLLPRSYLLSSFKKNLWPLPLFHFPSLYVSWSFYVALTTTMIPCKNRETELGIDNISLMSGGCWPGIKAGALHHVK